MKPYVLFVIVLMGTPLESYADSRDAAAAAIPTTVEIEVEVPAEDTEASEEPNQPGIQPLLMELRTSQETKPGGNNASVMRLYNSSGDRLSVRDLLGGPPSKERTELLSGTVVSDDGLIVTHGLHDNLKDHLVVRFFDNRRLQANVVLRDERSGLVLLKVDADDLPHLKITSTSPVVGQRIASVVTAHGYRHTFLSGFISARERTVKSTPPLPPVLQTDLAAGPGSNGGPVVDMHGELVGILASVPARGSQDSISFAIPSDHVRSILKGAAADKPSNLKRGYLGIELSGKVEKPVIRKVYENSPAQDAGLQEDDGIVAVDGHPVNTTSDVLSRIAAVAAGDNVEVDLKRGESEVKVKVRLVERPRRTVVQAPPPNVSVATPPTLVFSDLIGNPGAGQPGAGMTFKMPAFPSTSSIKVERSNVEEKIDQLSNDIQSLREQIERLAAVIGEGTGNGSDEE